MPRLQAEALTVMTNAFRRLEGQIEQPERVPYRDGFIPRYAEKGIHQALIQKLARSVSGLNAVAILLTNGYVQEVGVLFRTLDEIQEDIFFLATAETNGARTEQHAKYLEAFYAEAVFARASGANDIPKPNLVPRKKIRAHTLRVLGEGVNVSQALSASESVGTAYSGYVHAASENIMDMYGGYPPHFHLNGMLGTPRMETTSRDAENYVYRGLIATLAVAKAFGDRSLVEVLYEFLARYEGANGHSSSPKPAAGT
jgi:hypothetical protein